MPFLRELGTRLDARTDSSLDCQQCPPSKQLLRDLWGHCTSMLVLSLRGLWQHGVMRPSHTNVDSDLFFPLAGSPYAVSSSSFFPISSLILRRQFAIHRTETHTPLSLFDFRLAVPTEERACVLLVSFLLYFCFYCLW